MAAKVPIDVNRLVPSISFTGLLCNLILVDKHLSQFAAEQDFPFIYRTVSRWSVHNLAK